jgi:hypothetical protein
MPSLLPTTHPILWDTVKAAIFILSALFLAYQAYRVFVYPYYVSPLRHLPGPKVHKPRLTPLPET